MRAWLVLAHFGIEFQEELVLLSGEGWQEAIREKSPSGRVPVLVDGDLVIPETLAIIEYLAETFPAKAIWPRDRADRAIARAAASEMHAGFASLRKAAPMNLRASPRRSIKAIRNQPPSLVTLEHSALSMTIAHGSWSASGRPSPPAPDHE